MKPKNDGKSEQRKIAEQCLIAAKEQAILGAHDYTIQVVGLFLAHIDFYINVSDSRREFLKEAKKAHESIARCFILSGTEVTTFHPTTNYRRSLLECMEKLEATIDAVCSFWTLKPYSKGLPGRPSEEWHDVIDEFLLDERGLSPQAAEKRAQRAIGGFNTTIRAMKLEFPITFSPKPLFESKFTKEAIEKRRHRRRQN